MNPEDDWFTKFGRYVETSADKLTSGLAQAAKNSEIRKNYRQDVKQWNTSNSQGLNWDTDILQNSGKPKANLNELIAQLPERTQTAIGIARDSGYKGLTPTQAIQMAGPGLETVIDGSGETGPGAGADVAPQSMGASIAGSIAGALIKRALNPPRKQPGITASNPSSHFEPEKPDLSPWDYVPYS